MRRAGALLAPLLVLAGCDGLPVERELRPDAKVESSEFPEAERTVAPITSSRWSTEENRDKLDEAQTVMDLAGVMQGQTVADIGAGEGYYAVRLAERVGASGRVVAQDIMPATIKALGARVTREQLDNISVILSDPDDPRLPANSFDRVFLVRMYHEIRAPYEFLWRLRPSLRVGGRVIVVDADRAIRDHGTPASLLDCEMRATGYRRVDMQKLPQVWAYLAAYEASGKRPEPDQVKACSEPQETK